MERFGLGRAIHARSVMRLIADGAVIVGGRRVLVSLRLVMLRWLRSCYS